MTCNLAQHARSNYIVFDVCFVRENMQSNALVESDTFRLDQLVDTFTQLLIVSVI